MRVVYKLQGALLDEQILSLRNLIVLLDTCDVEFETGVSLD